MRLVTIDYSQATREPTAAKGPDLTRLKDLGAAVLSLSFIALVLGSLVLGAVQVPPSPATKASTRLDAAQERIVVASRHP